MSSAVAVLKDQKFTAEQMSLITSTVAKGASPDELKLFLYRCEIMDLNPLKPGQIHFVKYGNNPGTIVVGIDGFRSIAARTGKQSGIERGVKRDAKGAITHGWAKVYRKDWTNPAYEESPMAEYNTGRGPWQKMPESMIKKVAEAAALRMAFPDDLGGIYAQEEMEQAGGHTPTGQVMSAPITPSSMQPPEDQINHSVEYTIPFGKFAKRTLEEVGPSDLGNYVAYLEASIKKKGEQPKPQVTEFIDRACEFIAAFENQGIDGEET